VGGVPWRRAGASSVGASVACVCKTGRRGELIININHSASPLLVSILCSTRLVQVVFVSGAEHCGRVRAPRSELARHRKPGAGRNTSVDGVLFGCMKKQRACDISQGFMAAKAGGADGVSSLNSFISSAAGNGEFLFAVVCREQGIAFAFRFMCASRAGLCRLRKKAGGDGPRPLAARLLLVF
jgi:hypothetical protein